jgi:hypothetical protein
MLCLYEPYMNVFLDVYIVVVVVVAVGAMLYYAFQGLRINCRRV